MEILGQALPPVNRIHPAAAATRTAMTSIKVDVSHVRAWKRWGEALPRPRAGPGVPGPYGISAFQIGCTQSSLAMSYTMKSESNCQ